MPSGYWLLLDIPEEVHTAKRELVIANARPRELRHDDDDGHSRLDAVQTGDIST
jgi:hypothetical protein